MKVLIVSPHPDDEAIGLGGTIQRHTAQGDYVQTLFLTSGEAGIPDMPADNVRIIREAEASACALMLGTREPIFWREPDGALRVNDSLVSKLRSLFAGVDLVYAPHENESHPDHAAAFRLVKAALEDLETKPKVLLFEVWTPMQRPDVFVDITPGIEQKVKAIEAHVSQATRNPFVTGALSLNSFRGVMQGPAKAGYAEAFTRMKGTGQMTTAVIFLTYAPSLESPRHAYATACLDELLANLEPAEDIHLHIADDGSPAEHMQALVEIANSHGYYPTFTNAERAGYGHSYNLATQVVHPMVNFVMPIEDDWRLRRRLNIEPLTRALEDSGDLLRCIRLGYLGWTEQLRGSLIQVAGQTFCLFDHSSPEHYVLAGHPRIETVSFEREVGPWPVGLGAGATEWEITGRLESRIGVGWPMDMGINASQLHTNLFAHIGDVSIKDEAINGS